MDLCILIAVCKMTVDAYRLCHDKRSVMIVTFSFIVTTCLYPCTEYKHSVILIRTFSWYIFSLIDRFQIMNCPY